MPCGARRGAAVGETEILDNPARIPLGRRPHAVGHALHQRGHHVVVEEAIHEARLERRLRIGGYEPHRTRIMVLQIFDDDARFDDGLAAVQQHGHAQTERRAVLVKRNQDLCQ